MKHHSSLKKSLLAAVGGVSLLLLQQPSNAWENNWGDNYNYNRSHNQHNYHYHQPKWERIEYNGIIIRTGIRPSTRICPLVRKILGHCDGYIGFDESTGTHIFSSYPQQQYYPHNQSGYEHYDNIPDQNQCVANILGVGLICPQVW